MNLPVRAWLAAARRRDRMLKRPPLWQEDLLERYAGGGSFVDMGGMWGINGDIAFRAEEKGAAPVTEVDFVPATPAFEERRAASGSKIRFVQGDMNDEALLAEVGLHDVVWCTGVLYHVPNPILTLERLRSITRKVLLLGTASIPEVPGLPNACVFWPGLGPDDRAPYASPDAKVVRHGISTVFDLDRDRGYGNWWWGFSPSALRGMLMTAGFSDIEVHQQVWQDSFMTWAIARPGKALFT